MNINEKHIAIDGKSCRGSHTKTGEIFHLLHAYLTDDCTFLGQEKTADQSNEITAIPILLEILDLKNALVSIDAMVCQIEIAEKIIEKGGIERQFEYHRKKNQQKRITENLRPCVFHHDFVVQQ